jgi:hypothetical protein
LKRLLKGFEGTFALFTRRWGIGGNTIALMSPEELTHPVITSFDHPLFCKKKRGWENVLFIDLVSVYPPGEGVDAWFKVLGRGK